MIVSEKGEQRWELQLTDLQSDAFPGAQGFRFSLLGLASSAVVEFPYDPQEYSRFACETRVHWRLSGDRATSFSSSAISFQAALERAVSNLTRDRTAQALLRLRFELNTRPLTNRSSIPTALNHPIPLRIPSSKIDQT